uniref:Uncharacterized protein n=1 Tax=Lepeophtheirus salmonis TaxID=72036 RepID=A0A0K2TXR0_LEPSM
MISSQINLSSHNKGRISLNGIINGITDINFISLIQKMMGLLRYIHTF